MKKYVVMLVGILSFIGVSTVKADTVVFEPRVYNSNYSYSDTKALFSSNEDIVKNLYSYVFEYYNSHYKDDYPYYSIYYRSSDGEADYSTWTITMNLFYSVPYVNISSDSLNYIDNASHLWLRYRYYKKTSSFDSSITVEDSSCDVNAPNYDPELCQPMHINPLHLYDDYYFSNFEGPFLG